MKVNAVGKGEGSLLWPSGVSAAGSLAPLAADLLADPAKVQPAKSSTAGLNQDSTVNSEPSKISPAAIGLFDDAATPSSDLLWPAALINQQAREHRQHNYTLPLAILAFVLSSIISLVVGPLQLVMIATTNNYHWVTTIFYQSMLGVVLPLAGIIAAFDIAILIMLWLKPTLKQRTILALILGSLIELGAIWIFGYLHILPPPQLMLALLAIIIVFFLAILFVNKQYVATPDLSIATKIVTVLLILFALVEATASLVYLFNHTDTQDDSELAHLTVLQTEARVEGVPADLSNLVFTLCNNNKYQLIYLAENTSAGLFECVASGEVYSVAQSDTTLKDTVTGSATYLGTSKDKAISVAFPNTYYLYRSLPDVLSEDELAIMFPATSEQELVDNFAPMLLNYWQNHSDHNLYLNVFYNANLSQINATQDYILMSALGTMVMVEGLPRGLTLRGVTDGEYGNYLFRVDTDLLALNELGALPDNYAISTRDALMVKRHLSLHLPANEPLDQETLVNRLWESFVGGAE